MSDDGALLQKFAETRDEACFEAVVQRYIGFVYAVSLRRLRDPHHAQDATQAVFIALARKAAQVAQSPSVMGWLHRSICYETRNLMRAQANRIARETEAVRLGTTTPEPSTTAGAIECILDEALGHLPDRDRNALLARYFSGHSYAQIGASLQLSENAARMRVDRALEKLQGYLSRKGITCTAAVLATALPVCASTPVATSMVTTITTASIASASVAVGISGIFAFMSTAKIITSAVVVTAVAGYFYQSHKTSQLEAALVSIQTEQSATTKQLQTLQSQITDSTKTTGVHQQATGTAKPPVITVPMPPPPGITPKAPTGWKKNGSANDLYEVGVDETQPWGGMPSAYTKSTGDAEGKFGGMMQSISAETYRNQRVKLTGWIKTEDANEGGHLWMRIDGSEPGKSLTFDNMDGRAPKGTTDWEEYSVVLDVPSNSTRLNYGFFVSGKGKMWVNGLTISPVGAEVQSTDMLVKAGEKTLPKTPVNLGFSPQRTN